MTCPTFKMGQPWDSLLGQPNRWCRRRFAVSVPLVPLFVGCKKTGSFARGHPLGALQNSLSQSCTPFGTEMGQIHPY
jgi:hypothetical protein